MINKQQIEEDSLQVQSDSEVPLPAATVFPVGQLEQEEEVPPEL